MNIPNSTRWHRVHGRPSLAMKHTNQQYLTDDEEAVLWDFILAQENKPDGVRIRNEELNAIAQRIRSQRHSCEDLCSSNVLCDMRGPQKDWARSFAIRQEARSVGTRGGKSARSKPMNTSALLEAISPMLRATKILDQNVYHLVVVGGAMTPPSDPRKLVTDTDLEAFLKRQNSAEVVTIIECISQANVLLQPLVVWPETVHHKSRSQSNTTGFTQHFSTGCLEEVAALYWLEYVFEPQTSTTADGRTRFLLTTRPDKFLAARIQSFCQERKIVLCDAQGAPKKRILPDVSVWSSRLPDIVKTLRCVYADNISLGMDFFESYRDARTEAYRPESGAVDVAVVQVPADTDANGATQDSNADVEVPTAAAFEYLVLQVQHDLACLDIDKEERELIDHLIATAKLFASLHYDRSAK